MSGTKVVSWVPFVGSVIPDESQEMHIRLKVALIDVKSGQWDIFTPNPFHDSTTSAQYMRESSDQGQVFMLKAYEATVEDVIKRKTRYSDTSLTQPPQRSQQRRTQKMSATILEKFLIDYVEANDGEAELIDEAFTARNLS